MSLVGSLEDLGLGDILQIISLSRKSGDLLLRSARGEGRILFQEGLIRGAFHKGGPTDLRGLVAGLETVSQAELDAACEQARAQGVSLAALLVDRSLVNAESLEELRRAIRGRPFGIRRRGRPRKKPDSSKRTKDAKRGPVERITISVSIGIARSRDGASPQDVLDLADKALYRAKRGGRNCVKAAR